MLACTVSDQELLPHLTTPQEIARSAAGGVDESINLDVHAIEELKMKATPTTNDLPKYGYQADEQGQYSECMSWKISGFPHPLLMCMYFTAIP